MIQNICDGTGEKHCAYFFFDGRDSQTGLQRHEQLVRSLIWQFSEQAQRMPEAIETLYKQCGSGVRQPSLESLQSTLLLVLCQFHRAYLIVDAMDECTDRSELLDWVKEIMYWKVGRLHVFATSREDVDIKIGLITQSRLHLFRRRLRQRRHCNLSRCDASSRSKAENMERRCRYTQSGQNVADEGCTRNVCARVDTLYGTSG